MPELYDPLTSTEWLVSRLPDPGIVPLDATFCLPAQNRTPKAEFDREHIPGARFFDIDRVADPRSTLPHMLPTPDAFAEAIGHLGISNTSHVVVYDNNGFMAAARVWWTFRVFGHKNVTVLNGGLKRWKAEGKPVSGTVEPRDACQYQADFNPQLIASIDQVLNIVASGCSEIIDARSATRFAALEPEPRAGLRSGHIPGSLNLPSGKLIDGSGKLKPVDELRALFTALNPDADKPVITTCGSGVTASILALGLYCTGNRDVAVYDGSWTEWGASHDTPVATG